MSEKTTMDCLKRILAVALLLLCTCLASACGEDEPWLGPLNPEFLKHIAGERPFDLVTSPEGHALGYIPSPITPEKHIQLPLQVAASVTDAKYDMRDPNNDGNQADSLLTAVRNQGSCGACWVFATYGSFEGHLKQTLAEVQDFSEDNLKHLHGFDAGPCDGGNIEFSTAYLSRYQGPVSEADDPYDQSPTSAYCTDCDPARYVDNVVFLPVRADTSDNDYIKQAVLDYGGLHTTLYWSDGYYNTTYKTYYYAGSGTNHAVVIVGWDDDKYVPQAPGGQQYGAFIVRNSWGSGWGEGGYFYVSYYDQSIAFSSLAHFDERAESAFSFDRVYYYDELGHTSSMGYGSTVAWAANWFVPTQDESLTAVGFYATDSPTDYEIYIYDTFNGSSFSDLQATKTGTVPHPGWYTVQLDEPVDLLEGDGFGVVIRFQNDDETFPVPLEKPIGGYSSGATANSGESYVSPNGSSWTDVTNIGGCSECNVCIKAFTSDPQGPINKYAMAFIGYGTYFWTSDAAWTKINNVPADLLASGDLNGDGVKDLAAVFNGYGTYTYIEGTWTRINSVAADDIATGDLDMDDDDDIAAVIAGYGTYKYIGGTWSRINQVAADRIVTGDLDSDGYDDDMVASFAGYGTYTYIHGVWNRIKTDPASLLATGDLDGDGYRDDVVATFPGLGKYTYIQGTWTRINSVPSDLASTGDLNQDLDDDIEAVFNGYGTYTYVSGAWTRINKVPADVLVSRRNADAADEIAAAFSGYGTYTYVNGSWNRINSVVSSAICSMDD
jgi:C1A family cysteine protease